MRSAFTLVEMLVVTTIMIAVSALAIPRLLEAKESADAKGFEDRMQAQVVTALQEAVRRNAQVQLKDTNDQFELSQVDGTQNPPDSSASTDAFSQLALPKGVTVTSLKLRDQVQTTTDFVWIVYPNGRASDATIEFSMAGKKRSLDLYQDGHSAWRDGSLSERATTTWTAGDLEQRAG